MIGATDVAEPNSDKVDIYLHHTQHCSRRTGRNGRTQVVH
jgi:hypothetical protein